MPESIEGLENCHVRYNLKVQVCSGGNGSATEILRVIGKITGKQWSEMRCSHDFQE